MRSNLTDLRWGLHMMRPKHDRRMAMALSLVERSATLNRLAGDPIAGWKLIHEAIWVIVDCGCPRELWPRRVREVIKEPL